MNVELGKKYKLCSHSLIKRVFDEGIIIKQYPLRVVKLKLDFDCKSAPFQLVFSVPKRNFKKAHDRNRIKRQMKEAFRLNKSNFEDKLIAQNDQLALYIMYTERIQLDYKVIESKMKKLIEQLSIN